MTHVIHKGEEKRVVEHLQVQVRSVVGPGRVGTEDVVIWEDGGTPGDEPEAISKEVAYQLEDDLMVNVDNFDFEVVDLSEAQRI